MENNLKKIQRPEVRKGLWDNRGNVETTGYELLLRNSSFSKCAMFRVWYTGNTYLWVKSRCLTFVLKLLEGRRRTYHKADHLLVLRAARRGAQYPVFAKG